MIPLTSGNTSEGAKLGNTPVRLFQLGGSPNLYFTDFDKPVSFEGRTYQSKGISYSEIRKQLNTEVDRFTVSIDNYDDEMLIWAIENDPIGSYSYAYKGFINESTIGNATPTLVDGSATLLFGGKNTALDIDLEFRITVKSALDLHRQRGPAAMQNVTCRWTFKDANCGYTGAETECNYTEARCRELGRFHRFGGFPYLNPKDEV